MPNAYERKFLENHRDEFDRLENGTEAERLHAIAQLERACYASGGLGLLTKKLVERIESDESELVRSWAMRALLHTPSEAWPSNPRDRRLLLRTLQRHSGGCGAVDFSKYVAWELLSVVEGGFRFPS